MRNVNIACIFMSTPALKVNVCMTLEQKVFFFLQFSTIQSVYNISSNIPLRGKNIASPSQHCRHKAGIFPTRFSLDSITRIQSQWLLFQVNSQRCVKEFLQICVSYQKQRHNQTRIRKTTFSLLSIRYKAFHESASIVPSCLNIIINVQTRHFDTKLNKIISHIAFV